ncbi:hypothetical protein ACRALDRAFT_1070114 [Sodiomyces alcalophilus JCM 7366]|uniref:uncharacterized protein n=1 Tax=Sodiomyces alcalophilus JCM 7366 TaxID=591952 RepID=UPI0039B5FDD3
MSDIQSDAGDTKASADSAKPSAWTPAEKNQLILRILNQALHDGSVDWKHITMPGRTTKAMQGQWSRIQAEMKALALDNGDENGEKAVAPSPAKPKKTATPRKRAPKKAPAADGEAGENAGGTEGPDGEVSTPTKPSRGRKRQSNAVKGSAKKKRTPKKATKAKAKNPVKEEDEDNVSTPGFNGETEEDAKETVKDEDVATNGETNQANDDSVKGEEADEEA